MEFYLLGHQNSCGVGLRKWNRPSSTWDAMSPLPNLKIFMITKLEICVPEDHYFLNWDRPSSEIMCPSGLQIMWDDAFNNAYLLDSITSSENSSFITVQDLHRILSFNFKSVISLYHLWIYFNYKVSLVQPPQLTINQIENLSWTFFTPI